MERDDSSVATPERIPNFTSADAPTQNHCKRPKMVASAVFITDLQGKAIISRNYRGDVPLTKAIERFAKYLVDVDEEAKKPVFHVDENGDVETGSEVGASGVGGETFVYVSVGTKFGGTHTPMPMTGAKEQNIFEMMLPWPCLSYNDRQLILTTSIACLLLFVLIVENYI